MKIRREIRCVIAARGAPCRTCHGWVTVTSTSPHIATIAFEVPHDGKKRTGPSGDAGEVDLWCKRGHCWVDMGVGQVIAGQILDAHATGTIPGEMGSLKTLMAPPVLPET